MKIFTLKLKAEQCDYLGAVLAEQQYKQVAELISDIRIQINQQVAENATDVKKTKTPASDIRSATIGTGRERLE